MFGSNGQTQAIAAVAALDDGLRSRLYAFVRRTHRPVTREEAAEAVGISRKLAAFHLDKLVDSGLLVAGVESEAHRVGRAPKVYEPIDRPVQVSVPPRHHDELARIFIDAVVTEGATETAAEARQRVAQLRGREIGEALAPGGSHAPQRLERALASTEKALDRQGYEPYRSTPVCLRLRNCPFHPLTARAPDLVCRLNEAFLSGFLDGMRADDLRAVLAPAVGECCVEIQPRE